MFKVGEKVKIAYPQKDLLGSGGDATEALRAGLFHKDIVYKIIFIRADNLHETLLENTKTGKLVSWNISWDCLAPAVARKRNLPAWW